MRFYPTGGGGGPDLDVITAGEEQVLNPYVIVDKEGNPLTGTMPDNGSISQSLNCGESYTIAKGYHDGTGLITANTLASQTGGATASDNDVVSPKTFWKDGVLHTGTKATMAGGTYTPSTSQQTIACGGKAMTSNIIIPAFSLPSANIIKRGSSITIYGQTVSGSFEGYLDRYYNIFMDGNVTGVNYQGSYTNYVNVGSTISFQTNSNQISRKGIAFNSPVSFSSYSKLYVRYSCDVSLNVAVVREGQDYAKWEVSSSSRYTIDSNTFEVALDISDISRQPTVFIGTLSFSAGYSGAIYRIVLGRPA